jgi:hypothetical protein
MGLVEIQKTLALLYTNSNLRNQFFLDPVATGKELKLSPDDIERLRELSRAEIDLFANSLKSKRLNEVRKLLPLSSKVMGKRFDQLFGIYFESYNPIGIKKYLYDAIKFSTYIKNETKDQPIWMQDLIRYESAWLQVCGGTRRLLIFRFRYAMKELVNGLRHDDKNLSLIEQKTLIIFARYRGHAWLHQIRLWG